MMTEDGKATPNYEEWYRETRQLSNKQWIYGFGRVERKITADIANDRDPWPPTTPAIFVAMCSPPKSEAVGAEGAASVSHMNIKDARHPMNCKKLPDGRVNPEYVEPRKGIESDSHKEKHLRAGNTALKDILGKL